MAKLVWRYSDDARAIIENVYKYCIEEKSLEGNCHCIVYGTELQHSQALADLLLRKLWKRRRRHRTNSNNQSNHRHPSKVSLGDFDKGVVRRTIDSMYSLKKVLSTLDNIRTELKQSIGYTGSKGRLRKDLLQMKLAYTPCLVNRKVLMKRQALVLNRIRYLRRVRELIEAGSRFIHDDNSVTDRG